LEHLQSALRAAQATGDLKEQLTTIARQLAYFGYLTYDTVVWVRVRRRPRTIDMMNVPPSGQSHQCYQPEARDISEGPKNLKPFLASWHFVQHHECGTQGEFPTRFTMPSWHQLIVVGKDRPLDQRDARNPRVGRKKYW
jgi:hypothetical protein